MSGGFFMYACVCATKEAMKKKNINDSTTNFRNSTIMFMVLLLFVCRCCSILPLLLFLVLCFIALNTLHSFSIKFHSMDSVYVCLVNKCAPSPQLSPFILVRRFFSFFIFGVCVFVSFQ